MSDGKSAEARGKRLSGAAAKNMERDEPLKVKADAENRKAANVKASTIETRRAQLPPNKR
ncbi:MAG TPA: hypothetical protein VGM11_04325 [Acidobacteriaceae bacterium]|jgi:hypothetical protein